MPGRTAAAQQQPCEARRTRHGIPATWMRAGTSKGLYLHRRYLPFSPSDWAPIISRAMGSDARQLDGLGGATSTTSKVAVIAKSDRPDADIDYTFAQVPIGGTTLDMTGNCGNIASGVGPFAVDEGLVSPEPGARDVAVRVYNTNTRTIMLERFRVDEDGKCLEDGDLHIPGLDTTGSPVLMSFLLPAGAMTGRLLPTGKAVDTLDESIRVSAVDAANPFVLVDGQTLPSWFWESGPASEKSLVMIESLRRKGAVIMGLAKTEQEAAKTRGTPKIAVLSSAKDQDVDLEVVAFSMGRVHGSLQLTGAVCIASALCTSGTVANEIARRNLARNPCTLTLRHPGGDMSVDVTLGRDAIESVTVARTARRLMEGTVYYLS